VIVAIGLLAGGLMVSAAGARRSSGPIPLLAEVQPLTIERDMPKAVQARIQAATRQAYATLKRASKQQPSRSRGCTSTDFAGQLGPPAPEVEPRVIGHHVEVVVRFRSLPTSLVCRPIAVLVSTIGRPTAAGLGPRPWTGTYRLKGPTGRVVIQLPPYARPPYQLLVRAGTVQNRESRQIKVDLACPATACLRGDAWGKPKPHVVLPLRGLTRAQLEPIVSCDGCRHPARAVHHERGPLRQARSLPGHLPRPALPQ